MPPNTRTSDAALLPPPPLRRSNISLFLDFDGTLVDLVDRPDEVIVDPSLNTLLRRLAGTFRGRIALVSGRSVAQLDHFLGGAIDTVAVIGSHGAELRLAGERLSPVRPPALDDAEQIIRSAIGDRPGVVVEVKTLGVAIHYRLAPDFEAAAHKLAGRVARDLGLAQQGGKMMIELHVAGHDKGRGIAALMQVPSLAGTVPVFVGDDLTDEAGFAAVRQLGGSGVLVGPVRETAARFRLANVGAVRAWLKQAK